MTETPKRKYTTIGISLPDDTWEMIDAQSDEWDTSRSATLRRIILEWKKSQPATPKKKSNAAMVAAVAA